MSILVSVSVLSVCFMILPGVIYMEDLAAAVLRGQVSSPQKRTKEEKDFDKAMSAQEHCNIYCGDDARTGPNSNAAFDAP